MWVEYKTIKGNEEVVTRERVEFSTNKHYYIDNYQDIIRKEDVIRDLSVDEADDLLYTQLCDKIKLLGSKEKQSLAQYLYDRFEI